MEMKHFKHEHSLILNEVYIASREGDECCICDEKIVSCKSFVYSCTRVTGSSSTSTGNVVCVEFLLHKSCAELPPTIQNPSNKKQSLSLGYSEYQLCNVCVLQRRRLAYISDDEEFIVCFECAVFQLQSLEDHKFHHPAHSQHKLLFVQHPSSFLCHACKMENDIKDLSYICTQCTFWMHKSCADAPASFTFPFHDKHPLILSFHLPQVYQKFRQYCKLCRKTLLGRTGWLYYCPKCRFFAHFHCARSSQMVTRSSGDETYPDLVHLPAADSSATNVLVEQFVKAMSTLNHNIIFDETSTIKHPVDCEHHLQLITYNELNDQKDGDNDKILLCDCCVKPIRTDGNQFYGCVSCKYFLHRDCAKLPNEIENFSGRQGFTVSAGKYSEPFMFFECFGCGGRGNGIFFADYPFKFHIGCTVLPEKIKHEAHIHQLDRVYTYGRSCDACGRCTYISQRCVTCNVYICAGCLMMERTDKHPWDPHPLHLIYEAEMVTDDHEHDFDCEFCSEEIDTNYWFYHCSVCDLSFHLDCFGKSCYRFCSNIKFGATDIIINKLHPHGLTFILNKKVRSCEICGAKQLGEPVLECTPCKVIFCRRCSVTEYFKSV